MIYIRRNSLYKQLTQELELVAYQIAEDIKRSNAQGISKIRFKVENKTVMEMLRGCLSNILELVFKDKIKYKVNFAKDLILIEIYGEEKENEI